MASNPVIKEKFLSKLKCLYTDVFPEDPCYASFMKTLHIFIQKLVLNFYFENQLNKQEQEILNKGSHHQVWLDHFYLLGRGLIMSTSKIVEFYRYSCCGRGVIPARRLVSLRSAGDLSF